MHEIAKELTLPEIAPITDTEALSYLRRSCKIAEVMVQAEQDAVILALCEQLEVTVTEEELQAAGDQFRKKHRLLGASETIAWLAEQRITVEDWSEGIRVALLGQKLKEHLFGESVDASYINHRDNYRRVALSQILVRDLAEATRLVKALQADKSAFCSLALEASKGKQSKEQGGFVGVRFLAELMPEITQALTVAQEGEVIGPVHTKLGFHVLKLEKWMPTNLSEVREQVIDSLFQAWLYALKQKP